MITVSMSSGPSTQANLAVNVTLEDTVRDRKTALLIAEKLVPVDLTTSFNSTLREQFTLYYESSNGECCDVENERLRLLVTRHKADFSISIRSGPSLAVGWTQ